MVPILKEIKPVLERYGVKKASLFGSYARGDFDANSDVDILIQPPPEMGMTFIDLKLDLEMRITKLN